MHSKEQGLAVVGSNESELPEGWTEVALGEVCQINPPKPRADEVPAETVVTFVPMPAVDADSGTIASPQVRPFGEVRKGFTSFRDNDVRQLARIDCPSEA